MSKESWKSGNMLYPLPAVMVSCGRKDEKPNIITIAWTGTICTNPAMLYISIRPERYSYSIIKETKEFVVNLTTEALLKATDFCGVRSGKNVDKFKEMKLTPYKSDFIDAPCIKESPVNIECRVKDIIELGSHHMFLAEVAAVHIDKTYLDGNGRFHLNDSKLIAYSHGEYFSLGKLIGTFGYSVSRKEKSKKKEVVKGKRKRKKKM